MLRTALTAEVHGQLWFSFSQESIFGEFIKSTLEVALKINKDSSSYHRTFKQHKEFEENVQFLVLH